MAAALTRFRVMAYIVGVFLLILVVVAMPLKYLAHQPTLVAIVGPIHGFLYMVYLVTAFDLAVRAKWDFRRTLLVLLAGTVPVMSFIAERKATGWIRGRASVSPTSVQPEGAPYPESLPS
jgi:integral membrane protein